MYRIDNQIGAVFVRSTGQSGIGAAHEAPVNNINLLPGDVIDGNNALMTEETAEDSGGGDSGGR
jgi:hypothetical protein